MLYFKRLAAVFCAVCCVLLSISAVSMPVRADQDNLGSITITCQVDELLLSGMQWNLYLVAIRNENYYLYNAEYLKKLAEAYQGKPSVEQPNAYQTVGQFKGTPVMLKDLSTASMADAAVTLENEAIVKQYTPDATVYSDTQGQVLFRYLPQGLYLLSGKRLDQNGVTIVPSPMLVEIIQDSEHNNLHVTPSPKLLRRSLSSEDSRHTVRKIWQNDKGYELKRNPVITVNIYKNGELYDHAELSEANGWEKSWYGEDDAEWRVEEVVIPKDYTVVYLANETQYVIENTYNPWYDSSSSNDDWRSDTDEPETSSVESTGTTANTDSDTTTADANSGTTGNASSGSGTTTRTAAGGGGGPAGGSGNPGGAGTIEKLPQTGQLWWPVPLLCLGGIVFVMIGWQLVRREEQP